MNSDTETADAFASFKDNEPAIKRKPWRRIMDVSLILPADLRCFGGALKTGTLPKCSACEYAESCRLVSETEPNIDNPLGGQDIDEVSEFAIDLADCSHDPSALIDGDALQAPKGKLDDVDALGLAEFLNVVLRFDALSLGTIAALFEPDKASSFPAVKKAGVKLGEVNRIRRIPGLAETMKELLLKIGVARQAFKVNPDGRRACRSKDLKRAMDRQTLKESLSQP